MKRPSNLNEGTFIILSFVAKGLGAPVAKKAKRWPIDLAVPGLNHASGGDLFNRKQISYAHSLSLSPAHDMTEILLKRK